MTTRSPPSPTVTEVASDWSASASPATKIRPRAPSCRSPSSPRRCSPRPSRGSAACTSLLRAPPRSVLGDRADHDRCPPTSRGSGPPSPWPSPGRARRRRRSRRAPRGSSANGPSVKTRSPVDRADDGGVARRVGEGVAGHVVAGLADRLVVVHPGLEVALVEVVTGGVDQVHVLHGVPLSREVVRDDDERPLAQMDIEPGGLLHRIPTLPWRTVLMLIVHNAALRGRSGRWSLTIGQRPLHFDPTRFRYDPRHPALDAEGNLVTEPFVDAHLHLCKVHTLDLVGEGPLTAYTRGTMGAAMDAIDGAAAVKTHQTEQAVDRARPIGADRVGPPRRPGGAGVRRRRPGGRADRGEGAARAEGGVRRVRRRAGRRLPPGRPAQGPRHRGS